MRMSILNTATTEQMGYGIISFFVYIKSTNQDFRLREVECFLFYFMESIKNYRYSI
ncbi:Hypothetical protein EHLA_1836 [Anaerobutyricum hallii]|uniref:Uncharacterized protein n=1 Tax=Anaerobutyricum hallii TaxID=39488 RepID=A0A285PSD4_9FIRM|nr:Hypothetical protein EHLA_1836 [Anaerobutyricum hallii]